MIIKQLSFFLRLTLRKCGKWINTKGFLYVLRSLTGNTYQITQRICIDVEVEIIQKTAYKLRIKLFNKVALNTNENFQRILISKLVP